ncbi:IS200/IS605 family transposase [Butyrivibrio sp. DSM 10294]|uniref:IS200/IS605 family transposase n=1 Tax=Butyrivibrio sp. DSM 10294 TaxID=2972457 RepID=UPI003FA48C4B
MLSAETDEDHIHMLISMPPDVAPVKLINTLKSQISKEVRIEYREHIEKFLWGDALFWSRSYFCATTGSISLETVKKYIESQRTDDHKRKYNVNLCIIISKSFLTSFLRLHNRPDKGL